MTRHDADHWDERYRSGGGPTGGNALLRMQHFAHHVDALRLQVTQQGERPLALDIACGAGGTLAWLALHGWQTTGVDVSEEALRLTNQRIHDAGLTRHCTLIHADLDHWQPDPLSAHLITQFFFLDRMLLPALREAIRPGGLLILETMNHHRLESRPQTNPAHLLDEGELLAIAEAWRWPIIEYTASGPGQRYPTDAIVLRRPVKPGDLP